MATLHDLSSQAARAIAPRSAALDQRLFCYVLSAGALVCFLIVCLALADAYSLFATLIALAAMVHHAVLFTYYRTHLGSRWPLWSFLALNGALLMLDFDLSGWRDSIALPAMIVMTGLVPLISTQRQMPFALAGAFATFAAMSVLIVLTESGDLRHAQVTLIEHALLAAGLTAITGITKASYEKARRQAEKLATKDPLTGILNRRAFMQAAQAVHRNASRSERDYCIISIDIDHFKRINDTYGHAAGDGVIIALSELVQNSKRAVDLWGRVGGEEFALAVPATEKEGGLYLAEKIRADICRTIRPQGAPDGPDGTVTVSIGVATGALAGEPIQAVLERADKALYIAKNGGRNRVSFQPAHPAPSDGPAFIAAAQ